MQKPGILESWTFQNPSIITENWYIGILEFSEPFHNCISTHIQNPVIFTKIGKPCAILVIQNPGILTTLNIQNPDIFKTPEIFRPLSKMFCFAKIVKSYNYFSKAFSEYAQPSISYHNL